MRDYPDILKTILQELEKAGAWSRDNYQDSAKLLYKLYKIDLKTMETVEERGGQREVLPVTDEVLSGLQRMADTFYELGEPRSKSNSSFEIFTRSRILSTGALN